jgi:hypothetical protein
MKEVFSSNENPASLAILAPNIMALIFKINLIYYDFCRDGLEEISGLAGTISNIISDQIGNNSGVTGIVFRNVGFYFSD